MGIRNPYNIALIREQTALPVILDAGVGTASRRGAGDGARLRRRPVRQRDLARRGPGRDGARDPRWRSRPGGWRAAPGRIPRRLLRGGLDAGGRALPDLVHPSDPARRAVRRTCRRAPRRFQAALVGRDRAAFARVLRARRPLRGPADRVRRCAAATRSATTPRGCGSRVPDARVERAGERLTDGRFVAAPVTARRARTRGELPGLPADRRASRVHGGPLLRARPAARAAVARARLLRPLRRLASSSACCRAHGGLGERALMMLRGFGLRSRS